MPLLVHLHDGGTVQHFRGDMFPYAPQKCTNPQISARHPSADPPGAVIILPNDSAPIKPSCLLFSADDLLILVHVALNHSMSEPKGS